MSGGTGKNRLDDEWEKQQAILAERRKPAGERKKYFDEVEKRREKASAEQEEKWGWQTRQYKKGEDPIDEWRKRRKNGQISDLEDQYGDPKKIGGIPLPSASFGVGGEFGVGGKFDNGGRFDLRLPYADQGWVDEGEERGLERQQQPSNCGTMRALPLYCYSAIANNPSTRRFAPSPLIAEDEGFKWPWDKKKKKVEKKVEKKEAPPPPPKKKNFWEF